MAEIKSIYNNSIAPPSAYEVFKQGCNDLGSLGINEYDEEVPWIYVGVGKNPGTTPYNWFRFDATMDSNNDWCFFGDTQSFVDAITLEPVSFSAGDEVVVYISPSTVETQDYPSYAKNCVLPKDISWTDLICAIIENHLY